MPAVIGLRCVRCHSEYPISHYAQDCGACRPNVRANLEVVYVQPIQPQRPARDAKRGGLWRYGDILPGCEAESVSLGEGQTPLHKLEGVGAKLGLRGLYGKDESRNPTWSFKDRLACSAVSIAKQLGARTIVSSSSGNAGAAAAAYASKARIPCVVFTLAATSGPMVTQMRAYGAKVVAVANKPDRWRFMEHAVRNFGWFPTSPFFGPVVGSNPYGIEGYKTLAYEIVEELGWRAPDWCILPVCYGDALVGMWRGFNEMKSAGWIDRMPRMVAAEIYGSLNLAMSTGADAPPDIQKSFETVAASIGATQGTFQALNILRQSGGFAATAANAEMMRWQVTLAEIEGLYVEPASAAGLVVIEKLKQSGQLKSDDVVISLLTASGLKDPAITATEQDELIHVPSDFDRAIDVLRAAKIFPSDN